MTAPYVLRYFRFDTNDQEHSLTVDTGPSLLGFIPRVSVLDFYECCLQLHKIGFKVVVVVVVLEVVVEAKACKPFETGFIGPCELARLHEHVHAKESRGDLAFHNEPTDYLAVIILLN